MSRSIRAITRCLALAACCWCAGAWAFPGEPLLQRFTPADFKATPYLYGVVRDAEGRLYVGNADGVLRMQGREWETIPLPGGMAAGSLARGSDGRVYLAGYDSFGVIDTAADGRAIYHDLRDAFGLKGADRALGWMGQVVPVADGVYFRAQHKLLFYGFGGRHRQWPMAEDNSGFSVWHENLYTLDKDVGLQRFDNGKLELVSGGESMRGHRGIEIVDRGDWALVVSVGGFYRLDDHGVTALDVPPIPADAGIFSTVMALRGGDFVVSTAGGILLEYDAGAHLLSRHKIARAGISGLETDTENGLWASSDDELVRLQVPSPWSRIDVSDLGGVIADCEMHRGALWLAVGARGLARMTDSNGSIQTDWIAAENRNQIFGLASTEDGLLVARDGGIDVIAADDSVTPLMHRDQPAYAIVLSRYDHDLAYAPGDEGVYVLRRSSHQWALAALLPAPELATQSLIETAPGVLWVNNTRGLPERWQIDPVHARLLKRERFTVDAPGFKRDPNQSAQVYALGKDMYVGIGTQAFRFDGRAFKPYQGEPFSLMQNPNSFQLLQSPVGAFAYTGNRLYRRGRDGLWKREDFGAQPVASQSVLRYGSDGVLRLSVWRALLQYRPDDKPPPPLPPLSVRLTAVHRVRPNGRVESLPIQAREHDSFDQDQSLNLQFTVFSAEPGVEYRYRIQGLTAGYTDWREQPALGLSGLDQPGDYAIEVQARTPSGRPVQPTLYSFSVTPRWYQITVVRLLVALGILVALLVLVRWRERRQARRYVERQQFLEARIAERTAELETVNRKLAELATEDSLTGVANRRALETGLQREWQRCLDRRAPISLLMIDVDHFKQYNDRHGHQAGDLVLKSVAERLSTGLEPQRELLARYGGEEFCLLLPGIALDIAQQRAEKLRKSFEVDGSLVTVSIGVAARVPREDDSPQALLRTADQLLYEAKRRGRNRVEAAANP
ncbi:MAG TPA: diguanylate cyclase [Xanthomonadaceae bacterium]|jgi:diguanylate cyclase (GGDEF)-like protein